LNSLKGKSKRILGHPASFAAWELFVNGEQITDCNKVLDASATQTFSSFTKAGPSSPRIQSSAVSPVKPGSYQICVGSEKLSGPFGLEDTDNAVSLSQKVWQKCRRLVELTCVHGRNDFICTLHENWVIQCREVGTFAFCFHLLHSIQKISRYHFHPSCLFRGLAYNLGKENSPPQDCYFRDSRLDPDREIGSLENWQWVITLQIASPCPQVVESQEKKQPVVASGETYPSLQSAALPRTQPLFVPPRKLNHRNSGNRLWHLGDLPHFPMELNHRKNSGWL
jgi:hypothetical protein